MNTINEHKYTKLNDNEPTYTNDRTGAQDVKDLIFSYPEMTKIFVEKFVEEDLGSGHNIITATFTQTGNTPTQTTENNQTLPQSKLETHKQHNNNTNGQHTTGQ